MYDKHKRWKGVTESVMGSKENSGHKCQYGI